MTLALTTGFTIADYVGSVVSDARILPIPGVKVTATPAVSSLFVQQADTTYAPVETWETYSTRDGQILLWLPIATLTDPQGSGWVLTLTYPDGTTMVMSGPVSAGMAGLSGTLRDLKNLFGWVVPATQATPQLTGLLTGVGDLIVGGVAGVLSRLAAPPEDGWALLTDTGAPLGLSYQPVSGLAEASFAVSGAVKQTVYNVRDYGAVADCTQLADGAMGIGSAVLTSATGVFASPGDVGKTINVVGGGAVTGRTVTDGNIAAGSGTLTSATAAFSSSDLGHLATVTGAGLAGGTLSATIVAVASATSVTVYPVASTEVLGATVVIGTALPLATTIASVQSATQVTLAAPNVSGVAVVGAAVSYGMEVWTDAYTAIAAALADAGAAGGGEVSLSQGHYRVSHPLYPPAGVTVKGAGIAATHLVVVPADYPNFASHFVVDAHTPTSSPGVHITDLHIDGQKRFGPNTVNRCGGMQVGSSWTVERVHVDDCNFFGFWLYNITATRLTDCENSRGGNNDNIGGGACAHVRVTRHRWHADMRGNAIDHVGGYDVVWTDCASEITDPGTGHVYLEGMTECGLVRCTFPAAGGNLQSDSGYHHAEGYVQSKRCFLIGCTFGNYAMMKYDGAGPFSQVPAIQAPILTIVGTPGTTTYEYAMVGHNANGASALTPIATTLVAPDALSSSNYVRVQCWMPNMGNATSIDFLRLVGSDWLLLANLPVVPGQLILSLSDQGQYTPGAYTVPGSNTTGAVPITKGGQNVIQDCRFENCPTSGVLVTHEHADTSVGHSRIAGNVFHNCNTSGVATWNTGQEVVQTAAINAAQAVELLIDGNTIVDDRAPLLMQYAIEVGASVHGTGTTYMGTNTFTNGLLGGIVVVGAATVVAAPLASLAVGTTSQFTVDAAGHVATSGHVAATGYGSFGSILLTNTLPPSAPNIRTDSFGGVLIESLSGFIYFRPHYNSTTAQGYIDGNGKFHVGGSTVSSDSGDMFIEAHAGNSVYLRPTQGVGTNQWHIDGSGNTVPFDGTNTILGTVTGHKYGTAANQKLAFWGGTPVVQPASHGAQTATGTWGATEQTMLQDVYDAVRAWRGMA